MSTPPGADSLMLVGDGFTRHPILKAENDGDKADDSKPTARW
jgi:hypothetical protein